MSKYTNADLFMKTFNGMYATELWSLPEKDFLEWLNAPAADVEPRWIPVTERLPDINYHYTSDVCLVYCDNGAYAFAELEENIFGQVGWDCEREDDYHEAVGTVVAWMPLPTPYKGGEEE